MRLRARVLPTFPHSITALAPRSRLMRLFLIKRFLLAVTKMMMRMKTSTHAMHTIVYSTRIPHTLRLCELASFFVGISIVSIDILYYFIFNILLHFIVFYCILLYFIAFYCILLHFIAFNVFS